MLPTSCKRAWLCKCSPHVFIFWTLYMNSPQTEIYPPRNLSGEYFLDMALSPQKTKIDKDPASGFANIMFTETDVGTTAKEISAYTVCFLSLPCSLVAIDECTRIATVERTIDEIRKIHFYYQLVKLRWWYKNSCSSPFRLFTVLLQESNYTTEGLIWRTEFVFKLNTGVLGPSHSFFPVTSGTWKSATYFLRITHRSNWITQAECTCVQWFITLLKKKEAQSFPALILIS